MISRLIVPALAGQPFLGHKVLNRGRSTRALSHLLEDRSTDRALEEVSRLLATDTSAVHSEHAFDVLLSIATDPNKRRWSDEWAADVDRLTRIHLMPDLGNLPCSHITGDLIDSHLVSLSDHYSKSLVDKAYQIIAQAVRIGVSRGIWDVGRDPMAFVDAPSEPKQLSFRRTK